MYLNSIFSKSIGQVRFENLGYENEFHIEDTFKRIKQLLVFC